MTSAFKHCLFFRFSRFKETFEGINNLRYTLVNEDETIFL